MLSIPAVFFGLSSGFLPKNKKGALHLNGAPLSFTSQE